MPAKIIDGDLLECDTKYIVHQCNSTSVNSSGIARAIFDKFPYSNIYAPRHDVHYQDAPGTIIVKGNGKEQRYVINLIGQFFPGRPSDGIYDEDSYAHRKDYFFQGLKAISKIENLESVAFPYLCGCGLAGGNWEDYLKLIDKFADHIKQTQNAETSIIKLAEI
jgi:O-acetyl-ADP-ribose deacetylase (regulator of RNase III)